MQLREVLVETATGAVLSMGLEDLASGSQYDPAIHTIVKNEDFIFDPPPYDPDTDTATQWYWDGSTFTTTAP
jgi:K+/H+ antiporter YhaU regulatory subunit KhtT